MQKALVVFREGNSFMVEISKSFNLKTLVLKDSEEKWESIIKNAVENDKVDILLTDITTDKTATKVMTDKGIFSQNRMTGKTTGKGAINCYFLMTTDANRLITDEDGSYKLYKRRLQSVIKEVSKNCKVAIIKENLDDHITDQKVLDGLEAPIILIREIDNRFDLLLIDHHATKHLPKNISQKLIFVCPCCISRNPSISTRKQWSGFNLLDAPETSVPFDLLQIATEKIRTILNNSKS